MIITENTKDKISTGADVAKAIWAILALESEIDRDREHMFVIGLTVKNSIKFIDLASLGTLTSSLVHPREIFRLAVHRGCASIIVAHNLPSGDPAASRDDIAVTERLEQAGEILGIKLLDHVIVGNDNGSFVSMLEKGYVK